jgi:hypothetical protein
MMDAKSTDDVRKILAAYQAKERVWGVNYHRPDAIVRFRCYNRFERVTINVRPSKAPR